MWVLYDEFFALLRECGERWPWWITPAGEIRTETPPGDEACPITAVCAELSHALYDVGDYRRAGLLVGLDRDTADAIAQAADLRESYNAHVRADLCDALQLGEQWGREGRWNDRAFHASPYPHQYDRPFHRGSGYAGSASAAWRKALSRSIPACPSVAPPSRLIVRTVESVPRLSISSGYTATPAASSYAFSVGISRPGCDFELERMAAD